MIGAQFTLDATSDVREIHDYVERYNVSAAERLVRGTLKKSVKADGGVAYL